jgi:hypothetical protein
VSLVADERRKASACFAGVAHPSPPPPPDLLETKSRAAEINAQREQMRRGENDRYPEPGTTEYEQFLNEDRQALVQVQELLKELGETQPILKSLLDSAVLELEEHISSPGRQLLQREDYTLLMTDSLSEHALQKSVGLRGIPGLTSFSCEALCAAIGAEADENCKAFAFKRSDPWSRTDLTGNCFLLKNSGACKVEDFATVCRPRATRPIPSAQRLSSRATGTLHAVLRVGEGVFGGDPRIRFRHVHRASGDDAGFRNFNTCRFCGDRGSVRSAPFELTLHPTDPSSAHTSNPAVHRLPHRIPNAPGAGGLPAPRSTLEAMSMVAFSRQQVWCDDSNPLTHTMDVHT